MNLKYVVTTILSLALLAVVIGAANVTLQSAERPFSLRASSPRVDEHAVILFDGSTWGGESGAWIKRDGSESAWLVQDDESVLVRDGDAVTRESFSDFQLHIEFLCPSMPEHAGQAKGNSGVYLHGRYEIQVLDSFGEQAADNGCGGIYGIAKPLVNASRPAEEWQTYDIIFRAPRFDEADALIEKPRVTVIHNGIVIHNNLELPSVTGGAIGSDMPAAGPIMLQDHGDAVRYRNIWLRRL